MQIKRPNTVKVFGVNAMQGDYLPVKFGTNVVVPKEDYVNVANKNFEYGLESLEGDLQLKDLNTVFFYQGALLKYLFEKGIPEFSTYENYEAGSVVQHEGNVWIATKDVKASTHEKVYDPCDPCGCKVECENPVYPSKEAGWCKFITSCEYDAKIAELEAKDKALEKAINDLKGVEGFAILPNKNTGALELDLELSDGSHIVIPMTKFGHIEQNKDGTLSITNANGTTLELPKYVAEHDLDQQKGFYFNTASDKWEVDLRDLVKDGSGLEVDREGYISVKPADFIDNNSLEILPTGKTGVSESWLSRILKPLKDYISNQKDANADALAKAIRNLEAAQKAYVDEKAREAEVMARGNYAEIKAYKENLDKLRQQVGRHENDLGNQANQLKALGLTDEEILALIQAGMNKVNPNYITRIDPVEGGVKVTYANGTTAILGGNAVATDGKSIIGNGKDKVLSVQLSKISDNKLRLADDGLYLGNNIEQTVLYVTNSGDDTNIGTREKPMRTLKAALDRIPDNYAGGFQIFLKENEHFELGNMNFKNCYLILSAYGDLVDSKYPSNTPYSAYYRGYLAKDYPRPTIDIRVHREDANNRVIRDFVTSTRTIELQGLKIDLYNKVDNDDKRLDGNFTGGFNSDINVMFLGCILEQKSQAVTLTENGHYRNDVFVRAPRISWITSILRTPMIMVNSTFNEKVDFINWGYAAGMKDGVQQFEPLLPNEFLEEATRNWKASSYVVTDVERHLTFGVQFSQDLFKLHTSESWGTAK